MFNIVSKVSKSVPSYRSIVSVLSQISNNQCNLRLIAVVKNVHCTPACSRRIYFDAENNHSHSILLNHEKYNFASVVISNETDLFTECQFNELCNIKDWSGKSVEDLVADFKRIASYCNVNQIHISDERLDGLVNAICDKCFDFSDEKLIEALQCLALFPETDSINSRNFIELWSALDDTCVDRVTLWRTDQMLLIADLWYRLHLTKTIKFTFNMLRKIERRIKKLTPAELVQTLFHINLFRKPVIDMFKFEYSLEKSIDDLTIDELGIVSLGFFKTQTKISNKALITHIFKRTMSELDTIGDITLVSILKNLRYSSQLDHVEIIRTFLEAVIPHIPRFSLFSCLHIALLGSDMQVCHQKCLEMVINKFLPEIKTARIKDMERLSFIIALLDFKMSSGNQNKLCASILDEIPNRIAEILKYPRCLPSCLHHLALTNHYSEEFISNVLDPKFLETTYGRQLIGREVFSLDAYSRINLRSTYKGHQLTTKQRRLLAKMYTFPIKYELKKQSATTRLLINVQDVCDQLYSSSLAAFILPHYDRVDILLAFDAVSNEPISLYNGVALLKSHQGEILEPEVFLSELENTSVRLVPVVVGGWNNFVRDEHNKPTGLLNMKIEQLKILGYHPVLISWFEWNSLSDDEKCNLLKNKIASLV